VLIFVIVLPAACSRSWFRTFSWIVMLGNEGVINQFLLWLGRNQLRRCAPALQDRARALVISLTQI